MPGLEEGDVDFGRILIDARQRESVEVVLRDAAVYDVALLVHRIIVEPGDLAFDLLPHRKRIDKAEPFFMRNVDADETHVALLADRDGMDLGADGGMAMTFSPTLLERDGARRALRQRRAPARHLRGGVDRPDHVGLVGKIGARDQLAT